MEQFGLVLARSFAVHAKPTVGRRPLNVRTRRLSLVFLVSLLSLPPATAIAATTTVCASGCMYSDLQAAINAAVAGDTLLLRAGETFHGNFILPAKSGTAWITIRSDASD